MIKKFITIFLILCVVELYSQKDTSDIFSPKKIYEFTVRDCFKNPRYSGKILKDSVKPGNIMKGQRVWRTISLENKQNQELFKSKNNCTQIGFFEVIKFGLLEKKLNAFASDDFNEAEKTRCTEVQVLKRISFFDSSEVTSFDADGNEKRTIQVEKRYLYNADVKTYLLKEDWVLNNYSGQLEKKIVAIAPLLYETKTEKVVPIFWLYYNEWKELFNSFEAKNYFTEERLTYKGLLEKKYFISRVSKSSNIFDRSVKSSKHGIEIFSESELIKEKMINSEKDLFQN